MYVILLHLKFGFVSTIITELAVTRKFMVDQLILKKYCRFDGNTIQSEASSNFPHARVGALGSYQNSPFVTGHSYESGVKTEILDFETNTWVEADDFPFTNDRYERRI